MNMENQETIKLEYQLGLNYLIRNQCAKELIEDILNCKSVELNYQNSDGDTAMHIAVQKCRIDIIELLIERGASVNIQNKLSKTPVSIAEENMHIDQCKWEPIRCVLQKGTAIKSEFSLNDSYSSVPSTSTPRAIKRPGEGLDCPIEPKRRRTNKYPASGLKTSLHGVIFQLKLLMLFAHRAINNNLVPFQLATEFDPAEKFDDIVFMSENTRVLQAKHKTEGERKRITSGDLMSTSTTAPFNLHKYFISFCKIKSSEWFKNTEVSDFIIITNADFDFVKYGETNSKNNVKLSEILEVERDLDKDKILFIDRFSAKKFKLKSSDPLGLKGLMKVNLLNTALETELHIDNINPIHDLLIAMKIVHFESSIESARKAVELLGCSPTIATILSESKKVLQLQETIYDCSQKGKNVQSQTNITDSKNSHQQQRYLDLKLSIKGLNSKNRMTREGLIKSLVVTITDDALVDLENSKRILSLYNSAESKEVVTLRTVESELTDLKEKIAASETPDSIRQIENKFLSTNTTKTVLNDLRSSIVELEQKFNNIEDVKQAMEQKLNDIISKTSFDRLVLTFSQKDSLFEEFFEKFHFVTNYPNERDLGIFIDQEYCEILNLLNCDFPGASLERYMLAFLKNYKNQQAEFLTSDELHDFFKSIRRGLDGLKASGIHQQHVDTLKKYGIRFKVNPKQVEEFVDRCNNCKQAFHFITTTPRLSAIKVLHTIEDSKQYEQCDSYIFTSLKTLLTGDELLTESGKESQEIILNAFKTRNSLLVIEIHEEADGENADRIDLKRLCDSLHDILANNSSKKLIFIGKEGTKFRKIAIDDQLEDEIHFRDLDETSQLRVLDTKISFQNEDVKLCELIDETSADIVFDQEILAAFLDDPLKLKIGDKKTFTSIHYTNEVYIERKLQMENGIIRDEADFCTNETFTQKTVVIANEAGMGKSTVLTSVANKIKETLKSVWVVRLNLNDFKADKRKSRSISKINFGQNDTNEAIKFVIKMISLTAKKKPLVRFQRNLFKLGLEITSIESKKPKIVVMFDGFDEVSRSVKKTTALIKALHTSQVAQIWISTRVIKKHHLEELFDSRAYNLIPLTTEEQIEFSSNWWKWKMKYRKSDIGKDVELSYEKIMQYLNEIKLPDEDHTTELRQKIFNIQQNFTSKKVSKKKLMAEIDALDFSDYIKMLQEYFKAVEHGGDNFGFTTNPLHLRMLAEVVYEKKFKLEKNLGLLDLYDEFLAIKLRIYYKTKAVAGDYEAMEDSNNRDSENLYQIHCAVSVSMLADDGTYKSLPHQQLYERTEDQNKQLDKVGFFKISETEPNEVQYVHRSYAEYFCSKYLIDNLENQEVQNLSRSLVNDDNKMLLHFFEKNPMKRDLKMSLFPDIAHKF